MISLNLTFFIQIFSFLFLMFVLKFVLYDPILKLTDKRDEDVKEWTKDSEQMSQETEEKKKHFDSEIYQSKREGMKLYYQAENTAKLQARKIISDKKDEINKILLEESKSLDKIVEKEKAFIPTASKELSNSMLDKLIG